MDYESAVKHYVDLRDENKRIEADANAKVAANKETMEKLGAFLQLKAEEDGLDKVPTKYGTVFWTNGSRCSVANADEFFSFVLANEQWELLEKRAAKVAVAEYIDAHSSIPPGLNFTTIKQINVRAK